MFILLLAVSVVFPVYADKVSYSIGKAYDKKGNLIYTEKHKETQSDDGKLLSLETKYYDLKNKEFAKLNSDFRKHIYVPDYKYEDNRFGRYDGVRSTDKKNKVIAFKKENKNHKLEESEFTVKKDLVSGQGLYSYVFTNFDSLQKIEKSIKIKFLIPMRQTTYSFKLEKHAVDKDKVVYRVKFSNWFLRMIAPYIEVTYSLKDKMLLKFEGPSNVPAEDEEMQTVVIKYEKDKIEKK